MNRSGSVSSRSGVSGKRCILLPYDLRLEETNLNLGIKTEVMFCTLPGENIWQLDPTSPNN